MDDAFLQIVNKFSVDDGETAYLWVLIRSFPAGMVSVIVTIYVIRMVVLLRNVLGTFRIQLIRLKIELLLKMVIFTFILIFL